MNKSIFETDEYLNFGPVIKSMIEYAAGFMHFMNFKGTVYEQVLETPSLETAAFLQGKRDGDMYYKMMETNSDKFPEYQNPDNRHMFSILMAEKWSLKPVFFASTEDILATLGKVGEAIKIGEQINNPFDRMFGTVLRVNKNNSTGKGSSGLIDFSPDKLDGYLKDLLDGNNA